MIKDYGQREQALDVTQSFIVQAPAGSGKTELLIQRFLALLSTVDDPESMVAITFTRKAAQEMRSRVVQALVLAQQKEPETLHKKTTWQLARAVLDRSQKKDWQLLKNPNRLMIQTFDSFCSRLARQLPLLSGFGGLPDITDQPRIYYEKAAEQVWLDYKENPAWSEAIKNLLWHVDNQLPRLQSLLADLLGCREQWLDYVGAANNTLVLKNILQKHLTNLIEDSLKQAQQAFPYILENDLLSLLSFAASTEPYTGHKIPLISTIPSYDANSLKEWKVITQFLLTNEGTCRKSVDKRNGFPAKTEGKTPEEKSEFQLKKDQMKQFLNELSEYPQWLEALAHIQQLPDPEYSAAQQQVIIDLLKVLTLAVAQLMLLFQKNTLCDFNQVLLGALQALGTADQPTDMALALDYHIQHILVDEFQDTSAAQFRLIERLTAGWEPDNGKTLFLVGDPMQSIYRFRQAEVGLFLAVQQQGIGDLKLQSLTLQVNFRSAEPIVEWINHHMSQAFPAFADIGVGAIPFTPAFAFHQQSHSAVALHITDNDKSEATQVVNLIKTALSDPDQKEIAVLVRSRPQLNSLLPLLQAENIAYHAVDIESLSSRPVLQDLLTLTRALLHPGDRLAWLAFLRAPWCALSLEELTYLVEGAPESIILDQLQLISDWSVYRESTQQNLLRVISLLKQRLSNRDRLPISQWILGVWLSLGGSRLYSDPTVVQDAALFFQLLEKLQNKIAYLHPSEMEAEIQRLYATPNQNNCRVQIMTMHKAKGLEFHTVIVPGLHATTRTNNKKLLTWWERPRENGQVEVLIAPLQAVGDKEDPLYKYLWLQQQKAEEFEVIRLLYVAFTRAKKYLHLLGVLEKEETGEMRSPASNSLLGKIWNTLSSEKETPSSSVIAITENEGVL